MSGGGEGDRPGAVPSGAYGDRRPSLLRTVRARLMGLDLERVATIAIVVAVEVPELVMFNGEPFMLTGSASRPDLTYLQVRAHRADIILDEVQK